MDEETGWERGVSCEWSFRLVAELDSSSHTPPLPLFLSNTKIKARVHCGPGTQSPKYSWLKSGPGRRGLGTRGVGSCQTTGSYLKLGFPTGRLLSLPPPSCRVSFQDGKQSIPGWGEPGSFAASAAPATNGFAQKATVKETYSVTLWGLPGCSPPCLPPS